MTHTNEFISEMKNRLLDEKHSLLLKSKREQDVDVDGDETDEIQGNVLIEINAQLSNRDSQKLSQIANALSRIQDGTYGICDDCEETIPEKRLISNPYFNTCVLCAESREVEEKQRKRS